MENNVKMQDTTTAEALTILDRVSDALNARKGRSAWDRGITVYALELVEGLEEALRGGWIEPEALSNRKLLDDAMLNGADDWSEYSWGGSSLIYDSEIAERLCSPSELRKTRGGERRPNSREEWLDTQARALRQAAWRVRDTIKDATA